SSPWPLVRLWTQVVLLLVLAGTFPLAVWVTYHMHGDATVAKIAVLAGAGLVAFVLQIRPLGFAAAVAMLFGLSMVCSGDDFRPLCTQRSFFGVMRVLASDNNTAHRLLHGSTEHGKQSLEPDERLEPWTYYHRDGPVGQIFDQFERREMFRKRGRIGVVGLGTGTIAAYGLPGQQITYFEIDPTVERIARNPAYFTYLTNCRANLEVVLGDARLSLDRRPPGGFDVLLIDAFSSDSIPIHLLTREAIQIYLWNLAPRGMLAVHISNRHLDLAPVLANLADDAAVVARVCEDDDVAGKPGKYRSTWVVLAREAKDLDGLSKKAWQPLRPDPKLRLWTDDFSNVVSVLRGGWDWTWLKPSNWGQPPDDESDLEEPEVEEQ
ncbi:MAG: fused MFS/spermidine synthase, partial [Thermoguttaceae bacterium]